MSFISRILFTVSMFLGGSTIMPHLLAASPTNVPLSEMTSNQFVDGEGIRLMDSAERADVDKSVKAAAVQRSRQINALRENILQRDAGLRRCRIVDLDGTFHVLASGAIYRSYVHDHDEYSTYHGDLSCAQGVVDSLVESKVCRKPTLLERALEGDYGKDGLGVYK